MDHGIRCDACGVDILWTGTQLRWPSGQKPCPACVDAIAMDLEQGMIELVASGKAVVVGKTKDGRNLYDLVNG